MLFIHKSEMGQNIVSFEVLVWSICDWVWIKSMQNAAVNKMESQTPLLKWRQHNKGFSHTYIIRLGTGDFHTDLLYYLQQQFIIILEQ